MNLKKSISKLWASFAESVAARTRAITYCAAWQMRDAADVLDPTETLEARAYQRGFEVAAAEIGDGTACYAGAQDRGVYAGDQTLRIAWERGYDAAVCAYRLGHDLDVMIQLDRFDDSLHTTASVVESLDGARALLPDPRQQLSVAGWHPIAIPTGADDKPWALFPVPVGSEVRVSFKHVWAAVDRIVSYNNSGDQPIVVTRRFGARAASTVYARVEVT